MSIGAGLGTTDEPAELVGHGPLDPELLAQLLAAGPSLRPVWVDDDGVPVAVGNKAVRIERGDAEGLRQALLRMQAQEPPPPQPRHPLDHPPPHQPPDDEAVATPSSDPTRDVDVPGSSLPDDGAHRRVGPNTDAGVRPDTDVLARAALGLTDPPGAHPPGTPGPYRVPRALRRLIDLRAPRCEWPGCGAKAVTCDAEHDTAWPDGPTCACNLGPCCRRHHRTKQQGFTKTRGQQALVTWTTPTGRRATSPSPHQPLAEAVRPVPALPARSEWDQLSPSQTDEELWYLDLLPADTDEPVTPTDCEPVDHDRLRERLLQHDTRWTLDLDDPYAWVPAETDLTAG